MNAEPIYLDHAATTPVRPEVREAMLPFLGERFGNPSSAHRWGQEAGAALEEARARLAGVIGASPSRIVFTAGGTEADNLAISGRARATGGTRPVACSAVEHRAVLEACRGLSELGITHHTLPVDREGRVEMDALDVVLRDEPCVVSVMWVNNEVGTIQPVEEIGARCREAGVVFHTDAVQALGKLPVRMDEAPVDLMAISAHKVGGPKGAGALYIREGVEIAPVIRGGSHERGLRAGTHNVAGAVGFARAAELAAAEMERETARLGRSATDSRPPCGSPSPICGSMAGPCAAPARSTSAYRASSGSRCSSASTWRASPSPPGRPAPAGRARRRMC
jgi:cysteine desulfurase